MSRCRDFSLYANDMQNNPLHISLFPAEERAPLEYQFLLSSCLDIFEARLPHKTVDQDFGLLQAVDERLAMYGWLTNTGVKFVVVVDMEGRAANPLDVKSSVAVGLRDADLKPVRGSDARLVPITDSIRLSGRCRQPTSCSCATRSIARMNIHQWQQTASKDTAPPKSPARSSFRRSSE